MTALIDLVRKYWLLTTLFLLTMITALSLSPLPSLPAVPGSDKTHHLLAYGGLILPLALSKPNSWRLLAFILLFIGYSGMIEVLQPYINRYGEVEDLLANCAGLGCGWLIAQIVNYFFPTKLRAK
ncbi:MAG: VanZ family protein [Cyanobacteria bacterium J06621_8]